MHVEDLVALLYFVGSVGLATFVYGVVWLADHQKQQESEALIRAESFAVRRWNTYSPYCLNCRGVTMVSLPMWTDKKDGYETLDFMLEHPDFEELRNLSTFQVVQFELLDAPIRGLSRGEASSYLRAVVVTQHGNVGTGG